MNELPSINIIKVNGGYMVSIPQQTNPFDKAAAPFIGMLENLNGGSDPMLKPNKGQDLLPDVLPMVSNCHIFDSWERVLAFLQTLQ